MDGLLGSFIAPITKLWGKRQDRKMVQVKAAAAIAQSRTDTENTVELSKQDLAKLRVADMGGSWKDEVLLLWILAFFTMPPLFLIFGRVDDAQIVTEFITHHFPPNTIALLIGAIFGISRLTR